MTTATEVITDAFTSLQVYSPGEELLSADLAQGFSQLNDMLDSWSNEELTCYATKTQSVVFNPGQYQYSIGVGGPDIDDTRPLRLTGGFGTAWILDPLGNRYPLEVIERDRWEQIGNILQVNANVPQYLWYDPQYPHGILNFFPIPNIGWTAFWDSYLQFTRFARVDLNVNLPPGYVLAMKRCLAIELAPYYPSAVVSPLLQRSADMSKANVKRTNVRVVTVQYDPEIVSRSKATFNVYRDSPGGSS